MENTYTINTLHREKFMICLLGLLFLVGGLSSLIPLSEMIKIVLVLCTVPGILFLSIKFSQKPSRWTVYPDRLQIEFANKTVTYEVAEIDHIRSLTRSGGNLYVIYRKRKTTHRYWRNKLFQADDDQQRLQEALANSNIEYHRL